MKFLLGVFFMLCLLALSCSKDRLIDQVEEFSKKTSLFQPIPLSESGFTFTGDLNDREKHHQKILSGGGGVALGDIDQDGLVDILFSGGYENSRLYKNNGDLTFTDITTSAGIEDAIEGMAQTEGINIVDINNDGRLDIYLCKSGFRRDEHKRITDYGKNLLYINQADGTFSESASEYGLDLIGLTSSAQFFDFDQDGDLDVYLCQMPEGTADNIDFFEKSPDDPILGDRLLENRSGIFVDVSKNAGILFERNFSLSTCVIDINNDNKPDLYVANDFFGRDFLYLNQGDGTFKESHKSYFSKSPMSAMGSDAGDINNDGYEDLFVTEMMPHSLQEQKTSLVSFPLDVYDRLHQKGYPQYTRNMLYLNINGEDMQEIGLMAGVYATGWSWGSLFFDADMDGRLDLMISNDNRKDRTNLDFAPQREDQYPEIANTVEQPSIDSLDDPIKFSPNFIYKNLNGHQFRDVSKAWGIDKPIHTGGIAYGDLDNDGDSDMVWNNIGQPPSLFRNMANEHDDFHYLKIKLVGDRNNIQGLGSKVLIKQGNMLQTHTLQSQRGFQSMPALDGCFGITNDPIEYIKVIWPDGTVQSKYNVEPDQSIVLTKSTDKLEIFNSKKSFFEDLVDLDFVHKEKDFNDFKQEPLLLQQYSRQGPALAIADVNQDGFDDLFIGGSAGQSSKLFVQNKTDHFRLSKSQPWKEDIFSEDVDAEFIDLNGDDHLDLLVASGGNERSKDGIHYQNRYYLNNGNGNFSASQNLGENRSSSSTLKSQDIDRDGDVDIFVGSYVVPGEYTSSPKTRLFIHSENKFEPADEGIFPTIRHRIIDATWNDVDQDGWSDLVFVGEWTGPTISYNNEGKFNLEAPILPDLGGWWQVVKTNDLDDDGDIDIIAGNHGLNSIFQATESTPMTLLINDFDMNGTAEPVLFKYTNGVNGPFPSRDLFCSQMPVFRNQYSTLGNFGKATYSNMFDAELKRTSQLYRAYEMRTCWFENLGNGIWKKHVLPIAAQSMQVNDMVIADFNGDTKKDILLGGGSNSNHYEYGAIDGLLILLLQDDQKRFTHSESKIIGLHTPIKKLRQLGDGKIILASNNGRLKYFMPGAAQ